MKNSFIFMKQEMLLFALILIDVDIFKSVNDIYGHAVGDAIFQKVTGSLKKMHSEASTMSSYWR